MGGRMQSIALAAGLLCFAAAASRADEDKAAEAVMTPRDLRTNGIVTMIGRAIELKAVVAWEYAGVTIPEDPRPMDEVAKNAGPLKISFDGPGFEDIRARKFLFGVGDEVKKLKGADGREGYACGATSLINGGEYVLKVRVRLRPSFKSEMLDNPEFVRQSNNPRYWSQTFELEMLGARRTAGD